MPTCKQGAGRNPDPGTNGTAFQSAQRQCGARRWAPEMPYAVGTLSHAQHHRVVCQIKGQRHEIVRVRAEPRLAHEKSHAHLTAVIIEDNLLAVDQAWHPASAGQAQLTSIAMAVNE